MRIVLFSDTYPPQINGVATATATLNKALTEAGHQVLVACPALEGQTRITYENGIIRVPGYTAKNLYSYKLTGFYYPEAFKYIKDFKPDVIHVQTEAGMGIFGRICASKLGVPLVYTYHTMYEDYTYYVTKGLGGFDDFAKKLVANLSVFLGDSATEFITTSEKTREALLKYGMKTAINVIPNGIDLADFEEKNIDFAKVSGIRKQYELDGTFSVLILGRLAKEKSVDFVLENLALYHQKHPELKLRVLIAGDGPDKKRLMKIAEEKDILPFTAFLGAVDHKLTPYFYRACDLFISASLSETQGLTYIEAMSSRELVLARKDLNLIGLIEDSRTGFFFTDETTFASQLDHILSLNKEEKDTIRKNAEERCQKLYSLKLYAEREVTVYEKAIRKYW